MKSKVLQGGEQKTFALIFDKGDELMAGLLAFAKEHHLAGSHFTAIGAFSSATLGFFDRETSDYIKIPVTEQVEVLALTGDIALSNGQPQIHAHVVVGRRDGTAMGGHVIEAHVWPTLEVVITESPAHLLRVMDQETGLALIAPAA